MPNNEWIRKTEVFLKERFDAAIYLNAHPDAKNYRLEHTYCVAHIARPFLRQLGLPDDRINDICYGTAIHNI